jgi:hypothetical protein
LYDTPTDVDPQAPRLAPLCESRLRVDIEAAQICNSVGPLPPLSNSTVERRGARVIVVGPTQRLFKNVRSTGEMGGALKEQALIVDTGPGLV